jgi:RNA polymerase sigma-70 factor (ECF subfamily)
MHVLDQVASAEERQPDSQQDTGSNAADLLLITRLQAGEAEAFETLFRQHFPKVYRQALHLLGTAAEAEEVAQEVFLTVYEKAHTFRGESAFTTWLYRLTVNAALSRLRRRKRRQEITLDDYLPQFRCQLDTFFVLEGLELR